MKRNVFVTSRAPRQTVVTQQRTNCIACNNTGYVPNPVFRERQMPCACQMKRLVPVPDVMTLAEAINARRKQSCGCQTHDHQHPVSDDAASIMSNPPTLADVLKARRAS